MKRNMGVSPLDISKPFYEEMEFKKVKEPKKSKVLTNTPKNYKKKPNKKKASLKTTIIKKLAPLRTHFNNIILRIKPHRKTVKNLTKTQQKLVIAERKRAILGIGLLLVVVSIAYSTAVIFIGVSSTESKIALLPQAIFALLTLLKAFSKIYK